jgi:hypothetical protein
MDIVALVIGLMHRERIAPRHRVVECRMPIEDRAGKTAYAGGVYHRKGGLIDIEIFAGPLIRPPAANCAIVSSGR